MKCLHFLIFLLLISDFTTKAQETIVLQPGPDEMDDAMIFSGLPDKRSADISFFKIGQGQSYPNQDLYSYFRGLFEFDFSQIPIGSTIIEAKLTLYCRSRYVSGSNEAIISRIVEPWNEYNVNWNIRPGVTTDNQFTTQNSDVPCEEFVDMDVTNLVQDMVNIPSESYGFQIKMETSADWSQISFFGSDRDSAAVRPKLKISYEPASPAHYYPKPPSLVTATYNKEDGDVTIQWKDNSDNESNFIVEKALAADEVFQEVFSTTDTFFIDSTSEPGVPYKYRVKAITSDSNYKYSGITEIVPNAITVDDENDTICDVYLMDPAYNNIYGGQMDFTQTFYPAAEGKHVSIAFSYVELSRFDYMTVYNGDSTSGELLKTFAGQNDSIILNSTDESGALTFKFRSFWGYKDARGWYGHFSCVELEPVPTDITITESNDTITLNWVDNAAGEDGFIIYRSSDGSLFTPIDTVKENSETYFEVNRIPGLHLYYKLRVIKDGNITGFSNTVNITLPGPVEIMEKDSIKACDYLFLDPGGFDDYRNNTDITTTLWAVDTLHDLRIFFNEFYLEENDYLYVYDGSSTSAPSLGVYSYSQLAGKSIISTNNEKCLTFKFTSSEQDSMVGWAGHVTCLPKPPTDLAVKQGIKSLLLTWADYTNYEVQFIIMRSQDSVNFTNLDTVAANTTSYLDTGLFTGKKYFYQLTMISDYRIMFSNIAGNFVPGPLAPSDLKAFKNDPGILLRWSDNSSNEDGFIILRSSDSISFSPIDTVGSTDLFIDSTTVPGNTYYYMVMAYHDGINSDCSNVVEKELELLTAPSGLFLFEQNEGVLLQWLDNSINEDGFIILRSITGSNYFPIDSVESNTNEYIDKSVEIGNKYYYMVYAYLGGFNSDFSNSANLMVTSLIDLNELSTIKVFPNPSDGLYYLSHLEGIERSRLFLHDVLGKNIGYKREYTDLGKIIIDIRHLKNGMYILKIITGNKQETLKLIKE